MFLIFGQQLGLVNSKIQRNSKRILLWLIIFTSLHLFMPVRSFIIGASYHRNKFNKVRISAIFSSFLFYKILQQEDCHNSNDNRMIEIDFFKQTFQKIILHSKSLKYVSQWDNEIMIMIMTITLELNSCITIIITVVFNYYYNCITV